MSLSPEVYRKVFLGVPLALAIVDAQGIVVEVNTAFQRLCSGADEQVVGSFISTIFIPDDPQINARDLKAPWSGKVRIAGSKNNSVKTYDLNIAAPKALGGGVTVLMLGNVGQIQVQSEEIDEHRAKRLEALGNLAGSIAHDLNNLLTGVLGHVSFLKLILKDNEEATDSVSAIDEGARRAAALSQDILGFTRVDKKENKSINLCTLVSTVVNVLRPTLKDGTNIDVYGLDKDVFVKGDETRLDQLIMNLAVNARDAISTQGEIRISVDKALLDSEYCSVNPDLKPGEYARFIVEDDGEGMSNEVQEKMYERFFTTKKKTGTGIGLAMVYAIVREHQGVIECFSQEGKGTQFVIYLPLCKDSKPTNFKKEAIDIPGGTEKILVVDDDDVVRGIIQRSLELLGYKVDVANGGVQGVEKYSSAGAYDLVILDMMMPDLSGDAVFIEIKKTDNNVNVLIASGYSSEGRAQTILQNGGKGFIQKPFAVEELAQEVRRCLDE